jgi:hypothetical protein
MCWGERASGGTSKAQRKKASKRCSIRGWVMMKLLLIKGICLFLDMFGLF